MSNSKSDARPALVVTPGEPAGIGPDICLIAHEAGQDIARLTYIADPLMIAERASALGMSPRFNNLATSPWTEDCFNILPVTCPVQVSPGQPNPANADYVISTLEQAVLQCESGKAAAMVTGPVNKAIINEGGTPFSGHTEWLAERTGTARVVMMLASEDLRVTLATTHLPLAEVPAAIQPGMLRETINIILKDLQDKFGIESPRLMVCGLNPHAGESGHLGREELDVISPVIEQCRAAGARISGPVPADTAFTPAALASADAVLAMYHDQGLPVIKHAAFSDAVNITLGLPLIRTSVDHGTAFDLAGTGRADHQSLLAAIRSAATMARARPAARS